MRPGTPYVRAEGQGVQIDELENREYIHELVANQLETRMPRQTKSQEVNVDKITARVSV